MNDSRATTRIQSMPKQPPHSIEAEQSVLGGLLLNNALYHDLADKIADSDFYRGDHQLLFRAIAEMAAAGKPFDFVTLTEHLRHQGRVEDAGGPAYIASLAVDTYNISNVLAYAEIVRERSVLRGLIAAGSDIGDLGYRPDGKQLGELLDLAEQKVFLLRGEDLRARGAVQPFNVYVREAEHKIEEAHRIGGVVSGLPTGLAELDNKTDGLHPGDLVIVAARPSFGKTSFAMTVAQHVAIVERKPVMVFTMEMTGQQLALRSLAGVSRVSLSHLRGGRLASDDEWDRVAKASAVLAEASIHADETGALSPLELRARARRQASRGGLALVVVDYIQLMQIPGSKQHREQEISEISRNLKALAKELRVPIIALSQLNRAPEKEDRVPRLSDLRESGAIEQDADVVLFIHRTKKHIDNDTAQVIVGKQRNGPIGHFDVDFLSEYCLFQNIDPNKQLPLPPTSDPVGLERFQ